jgi:hypothetical protein
MIDEPILKSITDQNMNDPLKQLLEARPKRVAGRVWAPVGHGFFCVLAI